MLYEVITSGGANLNGISTELQWTDPSGANLVALDSAYAGNNANPKNLGVLFPSQEAEFEWGFRLRNKNTTGVTQYIEFDAVYGSLETPTLSRVCTSILEIEPVVSPELLCSRNNFV